MITTLEVLFSPAEFQALNRRDLGQTICVVFDILRATSTMMTALANGAEQLLPVAEIQEALALRQAQPSVLLAGEREGVRIRAEQSGGIDFDLGNSPREFSAATVGGKSIVITTTNGTRALRACAQARAVLIGSFLGLGALSKWIESERPAHLLLVCAGTHDQAAYEDTLAAGALAQRVWPLYAAGRIADSSAIARQVFQGASGDLLQAMVWSRNGRRLLANAELREDVPLCLQEDTLDFVAALTAAGAVRRQPES